MATALAVYRADGACVLADASVPASLRVEAPAALREHFARTLRGERFRAAVVVPGLAQAEALEVTFIPVLGHAAASGRPDHVAVLLGSTESGLVRQLIREAEEARRLRDEFLSTASHELRTPLQAILGFARLLRTHEHDPPARDRALEVIERNARQQAVLIENLLDVSRLVNGRLVLSVRRVDVAELLRETIEVVSAAADAKGIGIEAELAVGQEATIVGDVDRLRQVFWNLLSNAVKFTPRGGRVDVRLVVGDGAVEARVRDTGRGLTRAQLAGLFERIGHLEALPHGGLGLGLAIVRHLVEMHGGWVRAESEGEGRGATFVVHLPVLADQNVDESPGLGPNGSGFSSAPPPKTVE